MRSPSFLHCLLASVVCFGGPLGAVTSPDWELVWSDEFSQADGSAPDPAKWGYDIGGGGWGNNELEYYTSRTENARIEGGNLVIEARKENYGGRSYTSARLQTKGKWVTTHGRIEARLKVPSGAGLWPALWMLGADLDSVGWPNCGEIDVMEHVGRQPKTVFGTIHGPGYSGGESVGGTYNLLNDVADDFHVFAIEWDPELIRWSIDGISYFTATPASLGGKEWVFEHPHFLILNMAVGGDFAGSVARSTSFPSQLLVDYVRVYQRISDPVAEPPLVGTNALINPDFETSVLNPWIGSASGGANPLGGYVESTSSRYYNGGSPGGSYVLTHSGQYVSKTFGSFTGALNYNGFYQDVAAEPGSRWAASGWALTHEQDLMSAGNSAWIEVSFRDASNAILSLYQSPILTPSTVTPGSWMNLEVTHKVNPSTSAVIETVSSMVAPAGTTTVRYQIVFRQPMYDGGSMYFDDLSLIKETETQAAVAAPVPPTVEIALAGGGVPQIELSFQTEAGVAYEVAYKTKLNEADWTFLENVAGDGTIKTVSYPMVGRQRFFQVKTGP